MSIRILDGFPSYVYFPKLARDLRFYTCHAFLGRGTLSFGVMWLLVLFI